MAEHIVLSNHDVRSLKAGKPVFVYIDGKRYVLSTCTDEYFEKYIEGLKAESEEN
jgi:hypothetical protein